jgi:hypothetical protein
MQFSRAVGWIALTSVLFAVIGGLIGWLMGTQMPGYYRSIFLRGSDPAFDPVAIGLGQGITQGLVLGSAIGLVLVLSNWWKEAKLATLASMHSVAPGASTVTERSLPVEPSGEEQIRLGN